MAKFCNHCGKTVETATDRESGRLLCAECGAPLGYSAAALPSGTVIAGYRIEEPIGQGGMGVVYRATQINLRRPAALKILSDELSGEPGFVEGFFHEARVAANLTHPNIVQAYAAGTTKEGINYFAMEFVDGESLDCKLKRSGPLAPVPAMHAALQLAKALEYAWKARRMCHGDIKPDNILVTHSGEIKLADLGLARSVHEESARRDVMVTPLYAAPELISGKQTAVSLRSDMYSFGAALYHIVVGHPPFESGKVEEIYRRHLTETPVDPIEINPDIPVGISRLILRLLEKNPENRPEDWTEVIAILSHILDAYEAPEEESEPQKSGRFPVRKILLIAGGCVVAALTVWFLFRFLTAPETPAAIPPAELPKGLTSGDEAVSAAAPVHENNPVERMRKEWSDRKAGFEDDPTGLAEACSRFLKERRPPEPLYSEIATERDRLNRIAAERERLAGVYRETIRVFLDSSYQIPLEDARSLAKRFRLFRMLLRQGRLPHLNGDLLNHADALQTVFRIMELRSQTLNRPGGFPYGGRGGSSTHPPVVSGKSPGKTPVRRMASAGADSRKTPEILNREYRALLAPHVRHFSPDLLRSQMAGFARRYSSRDCSAVRKAKAIAECLGDAAFLRQFYASLDRLREFPLSRFGENASLTGAERGSIRVTFRDGRITLRQRIGLMPENVARLRLSILEACRNPVLRKRLSPDFLYFLGLVSIFYDTSDARHYIRDFELTPARRSLLEEILRDIAELSSAD